VKRYFNVFIVILFKFICEFWNKRYREPRYVIFQFFIFFFIVMYFEFSSLNGFNYIVNNIKDKLSKINLSG